MKILFYGYGNIGRNDDGLGPRCIAALRERFIPLKGVETVFEESFQLALEDAELISRHDIVFLIDASKAEIMHYHLEKVVPTPSIAFTGHAVSPGYLSFLAQDLFRKQPHILLLHIKGYEWEFREGLSSGALENLEKTVSFVQYVFHSSSHMPEDSSKEDRLALLMNGFFHQP